jgi:hypothetical protein
MQALILCRGNICGIRSNPEVSKRVEYLEVGAHYTG